MNDKTAKYCDISEEVGIGADDSAMTEDKGANLEQLGVMLKPIRIINDRQELFVDLDAFEDDMDEFTIEQEWGRSTGATILPESSFKYDIIERIDVANRELDEDAQLSCFSSSSNCSTAEDRSQIKNKKTVQFSQTVHTTHYLSPPEGENDDHEDVETAGYWSAEEISATPEEDVEYSEDCDVTTCCSRQILITQCQTPESADNWYDSEDGSSVDLSALTDSVDRLDLSPLNTDSPDTLRPCTPLLRSPPSSLLKVGNLEQSSNGMRRVNQKDRDLNSFNSTTRKWNNYSEESINHRNISKNLNKWNRASIKINCWNLAENNVHSSLDKSNRLVDRNQERDVGKKTVVENKTQRRMCLSRQDQIKLPKYNGLRSEYGLSQQQLTERKRVKVERKNTRKQRQIDKEHEAEERKKANQIIFNNWLDRKRRQENETKNKKVNKWNLNLKKPNNSHQRAFSAQISGSRKVLSPQADYSKIGLLKRIMSASVNSPKEQMTYSIYLGLPVRQTSFKPL